MYPVHTFQSHTPSVYSGTILLHSMYRVRTDMYSGSLQWYNRSRFQAPDSDDKKYRVMLSAILSWYILVWSTSLRMIYWSIQVYPWGTYQYCSIISFSSYPFWSLISNGPASAIVNLQLYYLCERRFVCTIDLQKGFSLSEAVTVNDGSRKEMAWVLKI